MKRIQTLRVSHSTQRAISDECRWINLPKWMAWVELVAEYPDGSKNYSGCTANMLPWNKPRRPKKDTP